MVLVRAYAAVQKKIMEELRIENQMTLFELNENILLVRGDNRV